jgi:hypothetical protein
MVGVESKLGPLGTSATEWPILPTPGDYDDGDNGGMKMGRGNRSRFVYHNSHLTRPGLEPGPPRRKPATYLLSYGAAETSVNYYRSIPRYIKETELFITTALIN